MTFFVRVLILLVLSPLAFAVPGTINYQGRLLDNNGIPVTQAGMTFGVSIWSAATLGTKIYEETHVVNVDDGVYAFQIGNGTGGTPAWNPSSFFNTSATRYVQLVVNGETLSPRHQLLSAPFTLQSGNSDALGGQSISYFGTAATDASLQNQIVNLQGQIDQMQNTIIGMCNASATSKWSYKNGLCFGGTPNCKGLNFSGENLSSVTLNGADCQGALFDKTIISYSTYNNTNFKGANLSTATNLELVTWGLGTTCPDGTVIDGSKQTTCLGHLQ